MARDRTVEFQKFIQASQSRPQFVNPELRARNSKKRPTDVSDAFHSNYVDFMRRSREASRDLCTTYHKLEELNRLARKTTIFDWEETSRQLNDLVGVIKQDIHNLNRQIEDLRRYQMNGLHQNTNQNMESHSKTVILNLQQQLATMSGSFKNTLEIRTQNNQQQKLRRQQFSSPDTNTLLNQTSNSATVLDLGASGPMQKQQQLLTYQDNSIQFLEERANAMQSVESTIVELGQIFNQLATMVQQQEEMITRIDTNITDTSLNVESAHQSLLQYFQSVSNNRWLMIKVFGVLFTFFMVFVLFAT